MNEDKLYYSILIKSRDINFFSHLEENLQNKIILLLIHFSFIFNKLKNKNINNNQKIFDYLFLRIETDLREAGMGDMMINKKMKIIVNKFYYILINFDQYLKKSSTNKRKLLTNLLMFITSSKKSCKIIENYFDKFANKIDLLSINDIYSCKF